jgi:hypothetical protein
VWSRSASRCQSRPAARRRSALGRGEVRRALRLRLLGLDRLLERLRDEVLIDALLGEHVDELRRDVLVGGQPRLGLLDAHQPQRLGEQAPAVDLRRLGEQGHVGLHVRAHLRDVVRRRRAALGLVVELARQLSRAERDPGPAPLGLSRHGQRGDADLTVVVDPPLVQEAEHARRGLNGLDLEPPRLVLDPLVRRRLHELHAQWRSPPRRCVRPSALESVSSTPVTRSMSRWSAASS